MKRSWNLDPEKTCLLIYIRVNQTVALCILCSDGSPTSFSTTYHLKMTELKESLLFIHFNLKTIPVLFLLTWFTTKYLQIHSHTHQPQLYLVVSANE